MTSPITVPLLDLKAQYATIKSEVEKAVQSVFESQWFIMGPEVKGLEEEIAKYSKANFAIGCASGSDALLLALMALDIKAGDEVICPSHTFFATGGAIARIGAVPVFADIDPVTYNMDIDCVRAAAAKCKNLKAIMPVHLFGQTVDMTAYTKLADELGVPLIEDAAQAIGACDETGKPAGSRGTIGCFSFFPSKNLGACGDAGIVTTNDEGLAEKLAKLRLHGSKPKYYHKIVGVNSRIDALQAAVLRVKLRYLPEWHKARAANAARYDKMFADAGAKTSATPLTDDGFPLRTPQPASGSATHIYNQYVLRVPAEIRDDLRAELTEKKIGTEIYYPVPLHMQECFNYLGYSEGDLPISEAAAKETIALPIYPELTIEQQEFVAKTVTTFINENACVAKA